MEIAPASEEKNSLSLFKTVIDVISQTNPRLSQKLKQAVIDEFSEKLIKFAATEQNRIFTMLTAGDAKIFIESLEKCGLSNTEIQGITIPQEILALKNKGGLKNIPINEQAKERPNERTTNISENKSLAEIEKQQKQSFEKKQRNQILESSHIKNILEDGGDPIFIPLEID